MNSSKADRSKETKMYDLRRINFGAMSEEEVQDLSTDQTWSLVETSTVSGDRIVVSISGNLKRERIRGAILPLYEPPKILD
jgi:hypothetical protein